MTRAEYEALMERVLNDAERLEMDEREVVLVMSRNIYRIIREYEQVEPLSLLNTEPYSYGRCCGKRIGIIRQPGNRQIEDLENMIAPALMGMTYATDYATNNPVVNHLGDILVISEENENRLYQMVNTEPVQFNDMGLTVQFGVENTQTAFVANDVEIGEIRFDRGQLYIDNGDGYVPLGETGFVTAEANVVSASGDVSINYDTLYNAMLSTRSVKPKKTKEAELSPGDTELLDEFLNSFAQKGFLREA